MTATRPKPSARAHAGPVVVIGLLAGLLLAGCGQKGPLYLPERTPIEIGHENGEETQDSSEDEPEDNEQDQAS